MLRQESDPDDFVVFWRIEDDPSPTASLFTRSSTALVLDDANRRRPPEAFAPFLLGRKSKTPGKSGV
jgi:hypothetical protein